MRLSGKRGLGTKWLGVTETGVVETGVADPDRRARRGEAGVAGDETGGAWPTRMTWSCSRRVVWCLRV